MAFITINEEKCIGCSLCVKDCPGSCLYLENGKAHVRKFGCIQCGHCYAICPQGAIRMTEYDCIEEAVVPMTELDSSTLLAAMRSLIRVPKGQKAVTCMIIGYPAVRYRRIVPRKPLKARVL